MWVPILAPTATNAMRQVCAWTWTSARGGHTATFLRGARTQEVLSRVHAPRDSWATGRIARQKPTRSAAPKAPRSIAPKHPDLVSVAIGRRCDLSITLIRTLRISRSLGLLLPPTRELCAPPVSRRTARALERFRPEPRAAVHRSRVRVVSPLRRQRAVRSHAC